MIQSDSKMNDKDSHTLHSFKEFAEAREVVKDLPKIIKVYEKLLPVLYQYAQYECIWGVLQMVEDSKILAEMQLRYYSKIYKNKGEIDGNKTEKPSR